MRRRTYTGERKPKAHDEDLKKILGGSESLCRRALIHVAELHREAVEIGETVFHNNLDAMLSIAVKARKYSTMTPAQHKYVADVLAHLDHAAITKAALKEIDPDGRLVAAIAGDLGLSVGAEIYETETTVHMAEIEMDDRDPRLHVEVEPEIDPDPRSPADPFAGKPKNWGIF
jgi:hypothetical protein